MNKIIIIGNLTKDPEMGETSNGIAFCKMSVAVNRRIGKDCDFLNVTAWRATAENCGKYLSKGKKVAVVGSLQINSYEAKDGSKRSYPEIQAEEVQFLSAADKQSEEDIAKVTIKSQMTISDDELPF